MNNHIKGFTLLELLGSVIIMAILFGVINAGIAQLTADRERAYQELAFEINRSVGLGILKYANETDSRLPAPFSGTSGGESYVLAPVDPLSTAVADVELRNAIQSFGIIAQQANDDVSVSKNVRVYQRVQGLTRAIPVRGVSGDTALITYDAGVIYQTQCPRSESCNGIDDFIPGLSPLFSSTNISTWSPVFPDSQPFFISTLDNQRQMLELTMDKIAILIRKVQGDYAHKSINSAPNDITNFYMAPNNSGAPNLSIASGVGNEGCYDGWYSLSASNVNVLDRYGLNRSAYGKTLWGGDIQYCRDYDPSNSGKNAIPHSAAIRFHRSVTTAAAPFVGSNVIIAF